MPSDFVALSPEQKLGKLMPYDTALSDPPGYACATCHVPETGFTGPDSWTDEDSSDRPLNRGMEEHFRSIEGFPGYRVGRYGDVQSCWTRRGRLCLKSDSWRPLKPICRQGCPSVNLSRHGKKTARRIHRLVLGAFVGTAPQGHVACHNDGDRTNNCVENLRWDSQKANADDALRHGSRAMGSRCRATKLTEVEVVQIRRLKAEGVSTGELASRFDVRRKNIETIICRRSWKHLP